MYAYDKPANEDDEIYHRESFVMSQHAKDDTLVTLVQPNVNKNAPKDTN